VTVLIPSIAGIRNSPAERALHFEGIESHVWDCERDTDYARAVQACWRTSVDFTHDDLIILEHDIVPHVGAIGQLYDCWGSCCAHHYPIGPAAIRPALGCIRFSAAYISSHPNLMNDIHTVPWNHLDAEIYRRLNRQPHLHGPPLAHVKGSTTPSATWPAD
jgi:hypothetical protein